MTTQQNNTFEQLHPPEYMKIVGVSYRHVSHTLFVKAYNGVDAKFYKSEFDTLVNTFTSSRTQRAGIIFTDGTTSYIVHVFNDNNYNWYLSIRKLLGCDNNNLICYNNYGEEYIYLGDEVIQTKKVPKNDFKISIIDGIIYFNDIYIHYIPNIKPMFRIIHVVEDAQNRRFYNRGGTFDVNVYVVVKTYLTEFVKLNTISLLMNLMSLLG